MKKTAVVTGGASGIGLAISKMFLQKGYNVVVIYNNSQTAAIQLKSEFGAKIIKADISKLQDIEQAFCEIPNIHVLVNNSGVSLNSLIIDTSEKQYDYVMDVNLKGTFFCSKFAIQKMLKNKFGSIINISSMWGKYGASMESVYAASKAGINGLTMSLAKEYGRSGIRVNSLCCGAVDTNMLSGFSADEIAAIASDCSLQRIGKPCDIASVVEFLASDESSFITGQCISVDGGY